MKRAFLTPILLLVVFGILFGVVLWRDSVSETATDDEQIDTSVEVLSVDAQAVSSVQIVYGETTVEVARAEEGNGWMLLQPAEGEARPEKIEDTLAVLASVQSVGAPLEDLLSVDEFGLSEPSLVVTLRRADQEDLVLRFGDRDFTGDSVYLQREGDERVFLVSGQLFTQLQLDPEGLRKGE